MAISNTFGNCRAYSPSVAAAPQCADGALPAGEEALSAAYRQDHRIEWDAADGDLVLLGNLLLLFRSAGPRREKPARVVLCPVGIEGFERIAGSDVLVPEGGGTLGGGTRPVKCQAQGIAPDS